MISNQPESICAYANSFEIGRAYKRRVMVRRCHFFLSESIDVKTCLLKLEREEEGRKEKERKKKHLY